MYPARPAYRQLVTQRDPNARIEVVECPRYVVVINRPPARCEAASRIDAWKAAWLRMRNVYA